MQEVTIDMKARVACVKVSNPNLEFFYSQTGSKVGGQH